MKPLSSFCRKISEHVDHWSARLQKEGRNLSLHLTDVCMDQWVDYVNNTPADLRELLTAGLDDALATIRDMCRERIAIAGEEAAGHYRSTVKQCKQGELVRLSINGPVWVRGEYDRSTRKYSVHKYDDVNHYAEWKGERLVYIGFDF